MKIGVLSDTHDHTENISKAVNILNSLKPEIIIHLGDFVAPFTAKYFSNLDSEFVGIFGNNDGEKFGLIKAYSGIGKLFVPPYELSLEDKKFLLLHDPITLDAYIKSEKYDYILYGHLHKKDKKVIGNSHIFNPGEVCGIVSGISSIGYIDTEKNIMEIIEL